MRFSNFRHQVISVLMLPLAALYSLGMSLRLFAYRVKILKSYRFDIPTISIGNMSVGGAGKTPHVEYLVRLLSPYLHTGILSRGYGRKTSGYLEAQAHHSATDIGDESKQYVRKFPEVMVAVGEQRAFAIPRMIGDRPKLQTILLDDAFQHQAVKPSLNILLTESTRLFTQDYLLPFGRLREWRSSYKRADVIIVTKCRDTFSDEDAQNATKDMQLRPHQSIFFSRYKYGVPYHFSDTNWTMPLTKDASILLVCGIANTDYLTEHLAEYSDDVRMIAFGDHHYFDKFDIGRIHGIFDDLPTDRPKIILTTEKDATRLDLHHEYIAEHQLPIFVLPIEVAFLWDAKDTFDQYIKQHLLGFKA